MKAGGGKQKGSQFEREQAKKISLWLSGGNDRDLLWRCPLSGGRASQGSIVGAQYGDLTIGKSSGEYFPIAQKFISTFCVELKCHAEFSINKAWLDSGYKFRSFWNQVYSEAEKAHVFPMLIIKPNRKDELVILRYSDNLARLVIDFDKYIIMCSEVSEVIIVVQNELFSRVSPDKFLDLYSVKNQLTYKA